MRKFAFRLERLQRRAQRKKRTAAGALSLAQGKLAQTEQLKAAAAERRRRLGRSSPRSGSQCRVADLLSVEARQGLLTTKLMRADSDVRAHALLVEQKRIQYTEAQRQAKKFELLRERRFRAWVASARRLEQQQFDEIAGMRYVNPNSRRSD